MISTTASDTSNPASSIGRIAAVWGFLGAFSLIAFAIWRLSPFALELVNYELSLLHWGLLIANIIFMAHSEGYKGFQCGFSPRVAARTLYLAHNPTPLRVILAPLFVVGYFHASRKRLMVTYALTTMIIGFIIVFKFLEQPWRGIADAGVVVGLIWGVLTMWYFMYQAVSQSGSVVDPEVS